MSVVLEICSTLVVGWVAGAESASWSCVQPLVGRLPYDGRTCATCPVRSRSVDDQAEWSRMRTRWHVFQGVRSILLLAAFVLLVIAVATD